MPNHYRAFGLHIQSDFHHPELQPAPTCHETPITDVSLAELQLADDQSLFRSMGPEGVLVPCGYPGALPLVEIQRASVPEQLDNPTHSGYKFQATEGQLLIQTHRIGRILVSYGTTMQIQPGTDTSPAELSGLALGWGMAALLHQRGLLPIHGATLVKDGQAFTITAPNGVGKSLLSMTMLRRGYQLLDDNTSVIDIGHHGSQMPQEPKVPRPLVHPGTDRVKLWQDTLDRLQLDSHGLDPVLNKSGKFFWTVGEDQRARRAAPLKQIYALVPNSPQLTVQRLQGPPALEALRQAVYKLDYRQAVGRPAQLMRDIFKLGQQVQVIQIQIPDPRPSPEALADLIEHYRNESNHESPNRAS
jgi:hypothetical protein